MSAGPGGTQSEAHAAVTSDRRCRRAPSRSLPSRPLSVAIRRSLRCPTTAVGVAVLQRPVDVGPYVRVVGPPLEHLCRQIVGVLLGRSPGSSPCTVTSCLKVHPSTRSFRVPGLRRLPRRLLYGEYRAQQHVKRHRQH